MGRRRAWLVGGPALVWTGLLAGGSVLGSLPAYVLFLLALTVGCGLPILVLLDAPGRDPVLRFALAGGVGWAVLLLVLGGGSAAGLPPRLLLFLLPLPAAIAAALAARREAGETGPRSLWPPALLLAALVLGAWAYAGEDVDAGPWGRDLIVASRVRDSAESGLLRPADAGGVTLAEGTVPGTLGLLFRGAGIEPWGGWRRLGAVQGVLLLAAVFGSALLLSGRRVVAAAALVLALLGAGQFSGVQSFPAPVLPEGFGIFFLLLAMGVLLEDGERGGLTRGLLLALLAFGAGAAFSLLGWLLVALWPVSLLARRATEQGPGGRTAWMEAMALGVGLALALALRGELFPVRGEVLGGPRGVLHLDGYGSIRDPLAQATGFAVAGWFAFLLVPGRGHERAGRAGPLFCSLAFVLGAILIFNPLSFRPLERVWGENADLLMTGGFPVLLWAAWGLGERRRSVGPGRWLLLALLLVLLAPRIVSFPGRVAAFLFPGGSPSARPGWVEFLQRESPAGSRVLTDPVSGLRLEAMTPQASYCLPGPAGAYGELAARRRLDEARRALDPFTEPESREELLEEMGVEYLVLDRSELERSRRSLRVRRGHGLRSHPAHWVPDPRLAETIVETFGEDLDTYPLLYDDGEGMVLGFRPDAQPPVAVAPRENPYVFDGVRPRAGRPHMGDGIHLVGARPVLDRVPPGGTALFQVLWARRSEFVGGDRAYVVRYRFEHLDRDSWGASKPWSRLARLAQERLEGVRLRLHRDAPLLGGFLIPLAWRPLETYVETIEITIPEDLAPGVYLLRVELARAGLFSNRSLGEVLNDRAGPTLAAAGRLTVTSVEESP
jgi:hypothetical protein